MAPKHCVRVSASAVVCRDHGFLGWVEALENRKILVLALAHLISHVWHSYNFLRLRRKGDWHDQTCLIFLKRRLYFILYILFEKYFIYTTLQSAMPLREWWNTHQKLIDNCWCRIMTAIVKARYFSISIMCLVAFNILGCAICCANSTHGFCEIL